MGAVVSTCMRAHACRGTGTDHTWLRMADRISRPSSETIHRNRGHLRGALTWSKIVESMPRTASSCAASCSTLAESAWGARGRHRGGHLGCTHMHVRRGEHFACTGMHRGEPYSARTWPIASLRRLPLLRRSAFWRALRSSFAMCASRSKAAIANSTAVWRTPWWLHCEHEHGHSVAARLRQRRGAECRAERRAERLHAPPSRS